MYTYAQSLKSSIEYFLHGQDDETSKLNAELAAKVFVDKYAMRDRKENLLELNPDQMHRRMAKEFARIEAKKFKNPYSEDFIYDLFKNFERIIPQGGPMSGIGNIEQYVTLSNCYVLESPEDSYGGILKTDQQLVQISKRRGGVGIDLDNLRPENTPTTNSSRTSTGIISWMKRYSNSIREVGQGGRRGALMLTLSVHHPDILKFATVKNDDVSVTGANISVKLTDEFLNAVKANEDYELRWPVNSPNPSIKKTVKAREVWKIIINSAWLRAEPGLLFWDNILRESPADCYEIYRTVSTNPCSEIPLSFLDSCRLLVLNLFYYVRNPYTVEAYFDYREFYEDVQIAQRLMDDLIDLELEHIDRIIKKIENDKEPINVKQLELDTWNKIKIACENGRRTGLGITALADTMAACIIRYGTEKSINFVDRVYKTLKLGAYRSSVDMAKELGSFPIFDSELEKNCDFLKRIKNDKIDEIITNPAILESPLFWLAFYVDGEGIYNDMQKYGRRNIALLTTAPTGSTSIVASLKVGNKYYHNTSAGIEPVFMTSYTRKKKGNPGDKDFRSDSVDKTGDHWMYFKVYHSGLSAFIDTTNLTEEESPYFGACAQDIDWINRVKLQAAAQKHIDHAISSTINLPNDVSEETVAKIYETAWEYGLKGITVYRDGCRTGVLVKDTSKDVKVEKRPQELSADIYHFISNEKEYFVVVGLLNDKPYEIFVGNNISMEGDDDSIKRVVSKKNKTGMVRRTRRSVYELYDSNNNCICNNITNYCSSDMEALARLTSLSLRHQVADLHFVVQQLEKVKGEMNAICKLLARALKKYIPDGTEIKGEECKECGGKLVRQEGCIICVGCGYSKCS